MKFDATVMKVEGKVSKPSGEKGGGRFIDMRFRISHDDKLYKWAAGADGGQFVVTCEPKQIEMNEPSKK